MTPTRRILGHPNDLFSGAQTTYFGTSKVKSLQSVDFEVPSRMYKVYKVSFRSSLSQSLGVILTSFLVSLNEFFGDVFVSGAQLLDLIKGRPDWDDEGDVEQKNRDMSSRDDVFAKNEARRTKVQFGTS